jgi:hypothetical protein
MLQKNAEKIQICPIRDVLQTISFSSLFVDISAILNDISDSRAYPFATFLLVMLKLLRLPGIGTHKQKLPHCSAGVWFDSF